MSELRLRLATPDDAPAIARLMRRVARRWIVPTQPPAAVAALEASLGARRVRQRLAAGQRFHLALLGGVLVGVAAVRDDCHVFHLFVGTRYQGQGIARRLWERVRRDCVRRAGTRVFTLNAAAGAIPVYRHLGFTVDRRPARARGPVLATPMILRLSDTGP